MAKEQSLSSQVSVCVCVCVCLCVCVCACVCVRVCVCVLTMCTHYVYFTGKRHSPHPVSFFSLVQIQTTACFEFSDFSGCKEPLQWLYGQPPWHTPETEHNGYPQFTGGFTPILNMWVCTFTLRNEVDAGCPQLPWYVCVSLLVFTTCIL